MRFESKIKFGCQFISNKAQSVWAPVCGREVTDRNTPADCIIQQEDLAAGYVQICSGVVTLLRSIHFPHLRIVGISYLLIL